MTGIFVVFLSFMAFTKVIAIVQTFDHKTIFYRHCPLPSRTYDVPPNAEYTRSSAVVSITFLTGVVDDLVLYSVYLFDSAGRSDIERPRRHIYIVKTEE